MSGNQIVGRQHELQAIEEFLRTTSRSPRTFVLEGEAGIGKTRLWKAAITIAGERGFRLLQSRPLGSDVRLSYSGLADLLRGEGEELLAEIGAPQRRALTVALLLEPVEGEPPDDYAVAAGFLAAVRRLAEKQPVLVAVDDVQWLDAASARVLAFALRRLDTEPVGALFALRLEAEAAARPEVIVAADEERLDYVRLGPMSAGALHELVRAKLDLKLARPTLLRLHETSGGNPFFALQIVDALRAAGAEPVGGQPLPVPASLREIVATRFVNCSASASETLLALAALGTPSVQQLSGAIGDPLRTARDIDEAIDAGIVEAVDGELRFAHPLLASVHYQSASPRRRRALHRRLAELAAGPEERARHLALAATHPDAAVAAELEAAATDASRRGANVAAAELLGRAIELTPGDDHAVRLRRLLQAADSAFVSGDAKRAQRFFEAALTEAEPGLERAHALQRFGAALLGVDIGRSAQLLREAEREAAGDDAVRARILTSLAKYPYGSLIGFDEVERCARTAVELAERTGDRVTLARALASLAANINTRGGAPADDLMERAVRLEAEALGDAVDVGEDGGAAIVYAELLLITEQVDRCRALLERLCEGARRAGDPAVAYPLQLLAFLDFYVGRWEHGEALAIEALEVAVQSGREALEVLAESALGDIRGARGQVDEARRHLRRALALADRVGRGGRQPRYGLGLLALAEEDYEAAWRWLEPAVQRTLGLGVLEPRPLTADGIEALIHVGPLEKASQLLDRFEEPARRLDRRWALAAAARLRGLRAAERDELREAEANLTDAVEIAKTVPFPLERGRSLLALGSVQRRLKRKGAARTTLNSALAVFDDLGAPVWADRARSELRRIGGRVERGHSLSETETRISELARNGRSNKEIALALHLSVKTVEWNLSNIYRKVGVRSRTELAAVLRPPS